MSQTPSSPLFQRVQSFVSDEGLMAQRLPGYERRAGQVHMMQEVSHAIEQRETLLVEAPTGTGKSLGYLLPALLSGRKTVVSTATRTLQEQLFHRELPFAQNELGLNFEAALLKGRTNYLCLHFMDSALVQTDVRPDERAELLGLFQWSQGTATGDRAECSDLSDDSPVWGRVSTGAEGCLGQRCGYYEDCFVMKARRRAVQADLVVVNHSLLFADLSLKDRLGFSLLPPLDVLILDEAHGLEDIAANHFGSSVSDARVRQLARDAIRTFYEQEGRRAQLQTLRTELLDRSRLFFESFRPLFPKSRLHASRLPAETEPAYFHLDDCLDDIGAILFEEREKSEEHARLSTRCEALRKELNALVTLADPSRVTWVERGPRATFLKAVPIDVGPVFQDVLRPNCETLILTSATLSTGENFNHLKRRLGFGEDTLEAILESPFDYANQVLLYVPHTHPPPNSQAFNDALVATIRELVRITRGHALILFTALRNMRYVAEQLRDDIQQPVYVQGEGSREALLARFRSEKDSVLFATGSFWEGVDVQGEALSLLVIDKLPFAPPDDPLTSARIEGVGKGAFMKYQVPLAIISLKQGFGRLIRHRLDRGIVAICDPRLVTKPYGKKFLRSLPNARRIGDLEELSEVWSHSQEK